MAELTINKVILFNKGYILQTVNNLLVSTLYYLKIQTNNITYDRTYVPIYNNNTIFNIFLLLFNG